MSNDENTKDLAQELADALVAKREWPVTVTLATPVSLGKETIDSLEFHDGNGGTLKGLGLKVGELPTEDQLMAIAARMCGRLKVIELLSAEDVAEAKSIALGFYVRSQPGGKTRSR